MKRRDSLRDAMTAPVYTDQPTPPFLFIIEELIYSCYRFAPGAATGVLPGDVSADPDCTAIICIFRNGAGWGVSHGTGGFLSVVVEGYDAPDTGQGAWIVSGFSTESVATLNSRYYAPFAPGRAEIMTEGRRVTGKLWSEAGLVCEMVIDLHDAPSSENSTGDRYLGLNSEGEATSSIWSVTGPSFGAEFVSLTFGEAAPATWRALAPVRLEWGTLNPGMLCNQSYPVAMRGGRMSPRALLRSLDGLGRAACVLSRQGEVAMRNDLAAPLLRDLARGDALLPEGSERARLLDTLAAVDGRRPAGGLAPPFLLPRKGHRQALLAQLAPMDPEIAADGAQLLLLTDPEAGHDPPRAELLQALNLTPAEARVAALVGSGLPPREAAMSLGLTEATVRSTLKLVFSKLGVSRQAELVRLVARLDPG